MNYKEKYENLIEQLKKAKEEHGGYTFSSVIDKIVPELHESEDERIRKSLIALVRQSSEVLSKQNQESMIAWLEKQGEQMPNDKVEPKFRVGDWVVSPNGVYWHIDTIRDGRYQVSSDSGKCAEWPLDTNIYHRFTIQYAKKGDVLYCKKDDDMEIIVMYLGININNNVDSYCRYNSKLGFNTYITNVLDAEHDLITPANKEQRELLFSKMKEAGCEWDAEKKELTEIDQKPADLPKGENYGIDGLYNAICILEKTLGKVDGYQTDDGILEHKCAISAVKKLAKNKPAWSEEDVYNAERLLCLLKNEQDNYPQSSCDFQEIEGIKDWVESLKDRVQPQPKQEWSEEDEKMLNEIQDSLRINNGTNKMIKYECWFDDIKDKIQSKPKQEWGEVNDSMIEGIKIAILNYYDKENAEEIINWLKSLKPQKRWKPSKEQMEELEYVTRGNSYQHLTSLYQDLKNFES